MRDNDHRGGETPLDAVVRERGIDAPDAAGERGPPGDEAPAGEAAGSGPRVARVPSDHDHDTFSVEGIDTDRREGLVEAVLRDVDGVSAASATRRNGTVGVHHDPSVSREALREVLAECGLVVAPGDEAFEARRAAQFASARVAVAVLFGLMVATPYIAVLYPTRVEWLFYDPVTVQYLQSILDSSMTTHFFVNLGALSGLAFLVACAPAIRRAVAAARDGRFTNEAAFVGGVAALYGYSTLVAFAGVEGAVHYDLVAYAVVVATLWTEFGVTDTATDPASSDDAAAEAPADVDADEPVAMTDGGR
ncbi:heavy-metal-associated domain-containing protein [Halorubrum sp. SS7]|uniref:heavy-metal-associated domain-containing protein n=1 Tax=Halorubrum sp. SS7 TaxID=2518119 RepID=UPI0010F51B72|nr:heavy-metal-associated domain-containing protein [Halorubrum sp. SS7]TKX56427.1 heavy-metal-associated domain-containing protein [Halorubrum sp. SS7]